VNFASEIRLIINWYKLQILIYIYILIYYQDCENFQETLNFKPFFASLNIMNDRKRFLSAKIYPQCFVIVKFGAGNL